MLLLKSIGERVTKLGASRLIAYLPSCIHGTSGHGTNGQLDQAIFCVSQQFQTVYFHDIIYLNLIPKVTVAVNGSKNDSIQSELIKGFFSFLSLMPFLGLFRFRIFFFTQTICLWNYTLQNTTITQVIRKQEVQE